MDISWRDFLAHIYAAQFEPTQRDFEQATQGKDRIAPGHGHQRHHEHLLLLLLHHLRLSGFLAIRR